MEQAGRAQNRKDEWREGSDYPRVCKERQISVMRGRQRRHVLLVHSKANAEPWVAGKQICGLLPSVKPSREARSQSAILILQEKKGRDPILDSVLKDEQY